MLRIILIYGVIAGLIVGTPMVVLMLTSPAVEPGAEPNTGGAVVGYLTMIVALTAVFLGIKDYRDKTLGGVIKFLPAFGIGLAISAVASLGWVIGWEISLAFTHFDFGAMMSKMMVEQAHAKGASEAQVQKALADAANFAEMYKNPLIRMAMTFVEMFPIGVLISLISAGLLRNSRFLPARGRAA